VARRRSVAALIVDDNADGRDSLSELLGVLNYRVVAAANSPDALALLAQQSFDVVVLDLGLPEVSDGLEAVRVARTYPCAPPIVAFTGYAVKDAAMAAGCCAFVMKPDVEELVATVESIMRTKSAMPTLKEGTASEAVKMVEPLVCERSARTP
jgi:CheY-like chemotaxis protein